MVLRIIVLILALLGAGGSGFLFFRWLADNTTDPKAKEMAETKLKDVEAWEKMKFTPPGVDLEKEKSNAEQFLARARAIWFMLAGLILGVLGGVLAFLRLGALGGLLMLLAVIGPAVLNPPTLIFLFPLIISGGLAFLIKRGPMAPRRRPRVAVEAAED
jgi:hypothetical protein